MEDGRGPTREFRLRRTESPAAGVRRVATGRIEHALESLRDAEGDPVEAVHEARKDTKKLRAVLRLVRAPLGERIYNRENQRFRDAARNLSDVRDAQVRSETLEALRERFEGEPDNLEASEWDALERTLGPGEETPADMGDAVSATLREIESARELVADWELDGEGFELFEVGLRRAYGRGRKRMKKVDEEPTVERLHEWRKRTKDLWYHLRLLEQAWPGVLAPLADEVHELSDLLGDDHDLALLAEAAESEVASSAPKRFERLGALVLKRREELQRRAFALGKRIYAEKPKAFTNWIGTLWAADPL